MSWTFAQPDDNAVMMDARTALWCLPSAYKKRVTEKARQRVRGRVEQSKAKKTRKDVGGRRGRQSGQLAQRNISETAKKESLLTVLGTQVVLFEV